jgi:hypothetical protein
MATTIDDLAEAANVDPADMRIILDALDVEGDYIPDDAVTLSIGSWTPTADGARALLGSGPRYGHRSDKGAVGICLSCRLGFDLHCCCLR